MRRIWAIILVIALGGCCTDKEFLGTPMTEKQACAAALVGVAIAAGATATTSWSH